MDVKSEVQARQASSMKQKLQDVIIIEDDDEDGDAKCYDEDFDSDAGSRKFPDCYYSRSGNETSSAAASGPSDSSGEDDCLVVEPGPSRMSRHLHKRIQRAEKRPAYNLFPSGEVRRSSGNSSDCEIIEDANGKVRQDWEEAAFRKRSGNVLNTGRYRAESEGSTSASNYANNSAKQSANGREKGHANEIKEHGQSKTFQSAPSIPESSAGSRCLKDGEGIPVALDQQDSNHDCPDGSPEDATTFPGEETSLAENMSSSSGNDAESLEQMASDLHSNDDFVQEMSSPNDCNVPQVYERGSDNQISQEKAAEDTMNTIHEGLVANRERLKETEEFRHAEEEEWARRQLELQRQAQEAQRQRRRRKAEAERRIEMESRQRQRLEEIRQSQQKEEQNLGYKEEVRGRIRSDLERVAATCVDMATLLRRLGIQVEGGAFPTTKQVNAAYKKAILRFHPDRVAAMAEGDPSHQVEAEETFKLISRMKDTLQPVAARYFY